VWKLWVIALALLPTLSFAQLTPLPVITNLHQRFGLGFHLGTTNLFNNEAGFKWDPVTKQGMYHDGTDWRFIGYLYDDSVAFSNISDSFVTFTSVYWVADSTTNFARRTGETFTGPVSSPSFSGGGQGIITESTITVLGDTFGVYTNTQVIPQGTAFQDIFNNMLRKRVNPNYAAPSFALSFPSPAAGNYEVGTILTPQVNPTFTKNDAGLATNYVLNRNSVIIFTNSVPANHTASSFTVGVETVVYSARVFYAAGVIKTNNFGELYPIGAIPEGSLSASNSFTGRRRYWLGASTSATLLTNAVNVKALSQNGLILNNNQTVTIAAPAGTRRVVLAYPSSLGALTFAKADQPNADSDVLQPFVAGLVTNISVGGVSDFDPVVYRVYHWIPAAATPSVINFTLRIP
jgi:hypothetical protein